MNRMTVRTRFAPSPTGYLHLGGARTALFNWLLARQTGGQFVLRVEDTDRERSTDESVQAILDGMKWLQLDYDEGPFFQTERYDLYKKVIDQLVESGHAYRCYCSKERLDEMRETARREKRKPRYDGTCRERTEPVPGVEPVLRFKTPLEGSVVIDDLVKGRIEIDNAELDDLVICRSDGNPTYNLSVVADDIDMGITHVVRGDDHINNTPRQIHIFNALGATLPKFAHLPMILGDDGKRMSKRHGAVSVMQYQQEGILPQALLNYLARLGWSHGDQERAQTVKEMAAQSTMFYVDEVELDAKAAQKQLRPVSLPVLQAVLAEFQDETDWKAASLKQRLDNVAQSLEVGFGKIGQPLRVAITGGSASPDIADTLEMTGRERSIARVGRAIEYVEQRAAG
jgi:glutamyl-tRNA synthetase